MISHNSLALALLAICSSVSAADKSLFTRGPYPQLATSTGITIVWRTRAVMLPELRIGTTPGELTSSGSFEHFTARRTILDGPSSSASSPLHSAPSGTTQFEAPVTGLKPGTRYYYGIYDNGKLLTPDDDSCTFTTLPDPGTSAPVTFWVVGDSGTATASQKAVHSAFKQWRARTKSNVDFYVHVGDMAYTKGLDSEFQFSFFDIYGETLRGLTCWPCIGNHEGGTAKGATGTGPYFDAYISPKNAEAGGTPSGTESYYSWDFGKTHFIALNSHDMSRKPGGQMAQWLKADLEKANADWIIAYWHHPPYTKTSHDSDKEKDLREMRENIMPIIESGGVDLVLTGHSHAYERSFLLDGAYTTPTVSENAVLDDRSGDPKGTGPYRKRPGTLPNEGTLQIVAGHGGQALSRKERPHPVMRRTIVEWGSVIVEVKGDTLTAAMLNADGKVRDTVQIKKDAKSAPLRIARPKAPEPPEGPLKLKTYVPAGQTLVEPASP